MCEIEHVFGMVASHWQLVNADVDDDQRHSILLGRLLEVALFLDVSLKR